ncbi:hypothetical protein, partial [Massilibacteroides sp.]|uniref:hypothetical protein n=1 Tax=Massilibacteroides sp. TaxID=2034766 RepID=UPI00261B90F6
MAINVDVLLNAIDIIAKKRVESVSNDLTIDAEVSIPYNVETGEYKIKYQDSIFSAFSVDPSVVYKKGEQVFVLVPQGDFSGKKIILSRSQYSNTISANERSQMTNYYVTKGPNWIDEWYNPDDLRRTLGICACHDMRVGDLGENANFIDMPFLRLYPEIPLLKVKYPNSYYPSPRLNAADTQLQRYSENFDYIYISADFRTEFTDIHSNGQYGLRVSCIVDNPDYVAETHPQYDPSASQFIEAEFELSFSNFIGAPYQYNISTPNSAYFKVPKGSIKGLSKIEFFQDGNFAEDFSIEYDPITGLPKPGIENLERNNIFVSNIDIRFAEKINLTDDLYRAYIDTPYGDSLYAPDKGLGRSSVTLKAKLLYGFQDLTSQETCRIYWFREKYDMTLSEVLPDEQDEFGKTWYDYGGPGWAPISKLNGASLYSIDFDTIEIPIDAVLDRWRYKAVIVYNDEITLEVIQTVTRTDSEYKFYIEQYIDELDKKTYLRVKSDTSNIEPTCRWWLLLQDGSYRDLLYKNPIEITPYLINEVATFRAQVFLTAFESSEVTNLEHTIITASENDLFVKWTGQTTFNYGPTGTAKNGAASKEHIIVPHLTWAEGRGTDYRIEVLAPDGVILGAANNLGKGYTPENSMMSDIWIEQGTYAVHFYIKDKFDIEKNENTFILRIVTISSQEIYEANINILFQKDGGQGSQGSDFYAPILPCNRNHPTYEDFSQEVRSICPLVLRQSSDKTFYQDTNFHLYLRPFASKNGVSIESLAAQGYRYEVYWDVRFPQNAPGALANSSWLKLYNISSNAPYPYNASTMGKTNPANAAGYQAITSSDLRNGAIEVRFESNLDEDILLEDGRFNFIVKAQTDIYKDDEKLASISSIYPIDVFLNYAGINDFDPSKIYTNWPRYVDYNPSGYSPIVPYEKLIFRYGENASRPISPIPSYNPDNITPDIQDLYKNDTDSYYKPKSYFFFEEGYNGALGTSADASLTSPDFVKDGKVSRFIRNQVFRLDIYGTNEDINGWNGQGIDINEEGGTIFAPTIGAGYKDPLKNTFTGLLMGINKGQKKESGITGDTSEIEDWFPREDIEKRQYLTGLYGFQNGVSSFGIMENGTAYFGRADQGGRLVIDGFNATIYGGKTGLSGNLGIRDDMSNCMRLSFLDLSNLNSVTVDGVSQGFNGDYFGRLDAFDAEFPIWYKAIWKPGVAIAGTTSEGPTIDGETVDFWEGGLYENTFGPARASTTPAIEIGQHPRGLKPGKLPWDSYSTVLNNLKIPGDRNLLVTYDGTIWAMNGVFLGNVIGSNIIGGRIQGAEIGIGHTPGGTYYIINSEGDWQDLEAPTRRTQSNTNPAAFYVNESGEVSANQLNIYGGKISIKDFFVDGNGNIFQFGKTNLIGQTYVYGNMGVGPSGSSSGSEYGNFFQVQGQVGLGISKTDNDDFRENLGIVNYNNILRKKAMFGLDSSTAIKKVGDSNKGHLWPMEFWVKKTDNSGDFHAVFGTMEEYISISSPWTLFLNTMDGTKSFSMNGA